MYHAVNAHEMQIGINQGLRSNLNLGFQIKITITKHERQRFSINAVFIHVRRKAQHYNQNLSRST